MLTAPKFVIAALLSLLALPALAQQETLALGGDHFGAGQTSTLGEDVTGDAFLAGYDVTLNAPVGGSAHLAGFHVKAGGPIEQNLYAAGFDVEVERAVSGNLSAAANAITLDSAARIGGNARLAGATVTLAGPVDGAVLVAAETLTLSSAISGDLVFYGRTITFAPGARVEGALDLHAPAPIAVPQSVAPDERVTYSVLEDTDYVGEAGKTAGNVVRGFWPALWGIAAFWLLLVLGGAIVIAFMPRRLDAMHLMAETRPFRSLGWGALTFAMLLGLVPLAVMTIVGIFMLPFVLVFIAVALGLAYAMGAYLVGTRVARAFLPIDSNLKRLGVMAASIIVAVGLGLLPILGWLFTLLFTTFGLGATARTIVMPRDGVRADVSRPGTAGGTPATV